MIRPELEVIFLTADKTVKRKRVDAKQILEIDKKVYKLNPEWIKIKQVKNKNKHNEVYYFNDNPIPINGDVEPKNFLNDLIGENALKQTSSIKAPKRSNLMIMALMIFIFIFAVGIVFYLNPQILESVIPK